MHISEKHKVYWFTPQRTGTRSTKELLRVMGFQTFDHHFTFDSNKKDYFFVSNVRNPYSRLVSLFYLYSHHLNDFQKHFKTWVFESLENPKIINDYQLQYHKNYEILGRPFDKFIKQENLENDLKSLKFLDLENSDIKKTFDEFISNNKFKTEFEGQMNEKRKPWKEFYDEEVSNYVYKIFEEQFHLFGYRKESWRNVTP